MVVDRASFEPTVCRVCSLSVKKTLSDLLPRVDERAQLVLHLLQLLKESLAGCSGAVLSGLAPQKLQV